jgi:hypothetical protein
MIGQGFRVNDVLPRGALVAAVAALLLAAPSQADTTSRIRFDRGAEGAEVRGRIAGYDGASYLVGARAGQTLAVEMETSNASAYFNVTAPGQTEAMFIGSTSGLAFTGVLPATGDYRIDVYLMRNAARRDEMASYTLRVAVPAAQASAPAAPGSDVADGLAGGPDFWEVTNLADGDSLNVRGGPSTGDRIRGHLAAGETVRNLGCAAVDGSRWCEIASDARGLTGWVNGRFLREGTDPGVRVTFPAGGPVAPNGQPFDATGTIPCARYPGQPTVPCAFGVQRRGLGSADVFVAFPDGGQRLISFAEGEPRAADSNDALEIGRESDLWFVRIGTERYEIPDAVVTGG